MVLSLSPKTSPSYSELRPCQPESLQREQQVAPFLLTRARPTPEIPNLPHVAPRSWPAVSYYWAVNGSNRTTPFPPAAREVLPAFSGPGCFRHGCPRLRAWSRLAWRCLTRGLYSRRKQGVPGVYRSPRIQSR